MSGRLMYIPDEVIEHHLFAGRPDVMDVDQVGDALGVASATVRREIARGALECVHVGTCVRVTKTQLLRYVGEVAR